MGFSLVEIEPIGLCGQPPYLRSKAVRSGPLSCARCISRFDHIARGKSEIKIKYMQDEGQQGQASVSPMKEAVDTNRRTMGCSKGGESVDA